jgi:HD superfamily phosphohydrolase
MEGIITAAQSSPHALPSPSLSSGSAKFIPIPSWDFLPGPNQSGITFTTAPVSPDSAVRRALLNVSASHSPPITSKKIENNSQVTTGSPGINSINGDFILSPIVLPQDRSQTDNISTRSLRPRSVNSLEDISWLSTGMHQPEFIYKRRSYFKVNNALNNLEVKNERARASPVNSIAESYTTLPPESTAKSGELDFGGLENISDEEEYSTTDGSINYLKAKIYPPINFGKNALNKFSLLTHMVMRHPYMKRLMGIHQLAPLHLKDNKHNGNRFEHSLFTAILARRMGNVFQKHHPGLVTDEMTMAAELAGALHDVGHAPFSHMFEKFLEENGEFKDQPLIMHEPRSFLIAKIILEEIRTNWKLQFMTDEFIRTVQYMIDPHHFRKIYPESWSSNSLIPTNLLLGIEKIPGILSIVHNEKGPDVDNIAYTHLDPAPEERHLFDMIHVTKLIDSARCMNGGIMFGDENSFDKFYMRRYNLYDDDYLSAASIGAAKLLIEQLHILHKHNPSLFDCLKFDTPERIKTFIEFDDVKVETALMHCNVASCRNVFEVIDMKNNAKNTANGWPARDPTLMTRANKRHPDNRPYESCYTQKILEYFVANGSDCAAIIPEL